MKSTTIAYLIGGASIGLGLVDTLFGDRFAQAVGSGTRGGALFKAVGAREIATGVAGVAVPTSAAPIWARLAGDVIDVAALTAVSAKRDNPKRGAALAALALVAGVTAIDFLAARRVAHG